MLQSLRAFAKFRKATISFIMSARPFLSPHEHLGFHWTDFHENRHLSVFRKYV